MQYSRVCPQAVVGKLLAEDLNTIYGTAKVYWGLLRKGTAQGLENYHTYHLKAVVSYSWNEEFNMECV